MAGRHPIRYVFDTIHMNMTLDFNIKHFGFQQQGKGFGLIHTVNPTSTSATAK